MVQIVALLATPGLGGYFFRDKAAIQKGGAVRDGFCYRGQPITPGFDAIVQPAEAVCLVGILEDGQFATGDCTGVVYAAATGRDQLLRSKKLIPFIEEHIAPIMVRKKLLQLQIFCGRDRHDKYHEFKTS